MEVKRPLNEPKPQTRAHHRITPGGETPTEVTETPNQATQTGHPRNKSECRNNGNAKPGDTNARSPEEKQLRTELPKNPYGGHKRTPEENAYRLLETPTDLNRPSPEDKRLPHQPKPQTMGHKTDHPREKNAYLINRNPKPWDTKRTIPGIKPPPTPCKA